MNHGTISLRGGFYMRKNLMVLFMVFLMMGLFSYAALSQDTKPFDKSTYEGLIRIYMTKDGERPDAIESWKQGCLEMFQLNFQRFEFRLMILDIEPVSEGYFVVTARTELIGLCLDKNNEKFRVIVGRDIAFLFQGNNVMQIMVIDSQDPRMVQGWEGISI